MKNYFQKMYHHASDLNYKNILGLFKKDSGANFLDLGCDDGTLSTKLAKTIDTANIYGVDVAD